jgi:hypothetical protein
MGRVTKSRTAALALAGFAALSGACNDDKRARSDPPRELDVETARAAEDEPGEQHPIVELEGSGLRLDGKSLASTSAIRAGDGALQDRGAVPGAEGPTRGLEAGAPRRDVPRGRGHPHRRRV